MRKILFSLLLVPSLAYGAITFVGAGSADNDVDGASVTPTLHASTAEGDAVICAGGQKSGGGDLAISGYTELENHSVRSDVSLFCKIAGAGEGTPTMTSTDSTAGRSTIAQCATFRGTLNTCTGIVAHTAETDNAAAVSITTPALTVTTDNTAIISLAFKENDWNAENPAIPGGLTEIGQPERSVNASVGFVWAYGIQTTAANISAGEVTLTENSAEGVAIVLSLKPAVVTPLYTSDPAIQSRTTSSIVFRATTDTTGTRYGARLTDGSSAPTCDQLEAQTATGGVQYGSQAATAATPSDLTLGSITDGTVTDYYECLEDGSGNDSAVKSIANVYKTAAFSTPATVSAQSTGDYTITKVLDGAGSCTAVACLKDSTAPTVTQVLAGNCTGDVAAIATVTDASCEAGTMTLGSSLTRPIHDVYVAGTYGSQPSALTTLADEFLDAPAAYQYTLLASVSTTSWCKAFNDVSTPDIAAADVVKTSTATSPSSYAWTQQTDCDGSYTEPNGSRQSISYDIYDTSAGDWMSGGPGTLWFNNSAPVAGNGGAYDTGENLIDNVAMTAVEFDSLFTDADSDALTCTSSDTGTGTGVNKRPAGTSIAANDWTGTPLSTGTTSGSFTITCTDPPGDSGTLDVTWTVYDQVTVPNCLNTTISACLDALNLVGLTPSAAFAYNPSYASGVVYGQSPSGGASVNPFTSVSLNVSLGSSIVTKRRTLGLGVGVGRFQPEEDFESLFRPKFFNGQLFVKFKWRL